VAHIGLGANLGDAATTLWAAIQAMAALPGVGLRGVSRLYATAPVGPPDQPQFRNAVAALDVPPGPDAAAGAIALLVALKGLERAFGRTPRERWGPRELDLDLLLFGRAQLDLERPPLAASIDAAAGPAGARARWLVVPHPELGQRLFVLAPLADLAPDLRPPGWDETIATARDRRLAAEGPSAAWPIATWDRGGGDWLPG
jgi:2-amino-4-hydroxy-6-hydroxymethyldihydropteridine diphosphokinase